MKKEYRASLIINIVLIILFIISYVIAIIKNVDGFEYYSQDVSFLTALASVLYVSFLLIKKGKEQIPLFVSILRYIGTCSLIITFLVVVCILAPTYEGGFIEGLKLYLLQPSSIITNLICPVLSTISFIFFEGDRRLNKKKTIWLAVIPTVVYGTVFVSLNVFRIIEGPYPFLQVYKQEWYLTLMGIVLIVVANYLVARYVLLFNQMHAPRIKRNKEVSE